MRDYKNPYGLLNATAEETKDGSTSENSILVEAQHLRLWEMNYGTKILRDYETCKRFIEKSRSPNGMFTNNPETWGTEDEYLSKDQVAAICAISVKQGWDYHKEIWNHLKSHCFTYDNVSGQINPLRFLHLRELLFVAYLNGIKWALPFLCPFIIWAYWFHNKATNGKIKTDGEIISFVMSWVLPKNNIFWKLTRLICNWKIKKRFDFGILGLFVERYSLDHPNVTLAKEASEHNKLEL